jgi:adenylate kinase family enzyme
MTVPIPLIVGLVGVTNVGKTTLLDYLRQRAGYGFIEIGKEMRRRYPPSHFQGLGAMKATEDEVWQIFDEQYAAACAAGAVIIISDGQPRMVDQVHTMHRKVGDFHVLQLHAPFEVIEERAEKRDGHDPEKFDLTVRRLANDYRQLYEVMATYVRFIPHRPIIVNTTDLGWLEQADHLLKATLRKHI